ncbi:MAG: amino acid dehydrogenase [Gammaproteobacteria bacterium]|nr:amino acid dehydrogenase [Gammaproteobacteria bacterium]
MKIIDYTSVAAKTDSFDAHERVSLVQDEDSGLQALIAIHNTNLGPAVGGCRMFPYENIEAALKDVLRLSRGMTYKSAVANLPMGGGKAVIIGDPAADKSEALLQKMGEFIDFHQGSYVTAEDSGMCVDDLKTMATKTEHVLGIAPEQRYGGDPSPLTAMGIFSGIEAAVKHKLGRSTLHGIDVAIQGAGAVGRSLTKELLGAGARVIVCDINQDNIDKACELGASVTSVDEIFSLPVDVFCPCAMGGILNAQTIPSIVAPIIAGGANNQLSQPADALSLHQRGTLYVPDFVINAGGIIEICRQLKGGDESRWHAKIVGIGATLAEVFAQSDQQDLPTSVIAEKLAESSFKQDSMNTSAA